VTKIDKLITKIKSNPKDFTWAELSKLLDNLGFQEYGAGKTGGSRRKFYNKKLNLMVNLHKPHPHPILKHYAVKQVKELLEEGGLI
jgi:poly-D-alanine transfer protein DltD